MKQQRVRIIGGTYRGKLISFPDKSDLRPTPDRVRETLFNWLMHHIRGARCLDAFAGSGAIGFEAMSRGASHVVMLDTDPDIVKALKRTHKDMQIDTLEILQADASEYLRKAHMPFDIVFLDPPFSNPALYQQALLTLETLNILSKDGLLYLETPSPVTPDPDHWETIQTKHAGQVWYGLYRKADPRKHMVERREGKPRR